VRVAVRPPRLGSDWHLTLNRALAVTSLCSCTEVRAVRNSNSATPETPVRMNVDILCSSRELFGADRSALRLAEALRILGLSPTLVLPANRPELGLSEEAAKRGLSAREEPIAIASSHGIETPLAVAAIRRRKGSADLTIFNSTAVLGSPRPVLKKVVVVREWLEPKSLRHRLLVAKHRFGADAVVGVSSEVVDQWRKNTRGPARQYVVHNWLDRAMLKKTADEAGGERAGVLCIGRFNRWKGQDVLADAYEQAFSARAERPVLRFVGSQPGTNFEARSAALAERGRHLGWEVLPFTSDPSDHFWSTALVVVPSLQPEPFGTVILEAIGHGCRVIAFDGGGPSDLAKSFPGIVELAPRDRSALAAALAGWWDRGGAALSVEESSQARRTLESHYSPEAGAASWQTVLDGLVS
jgi:glycosyltransferase involved in cell wall biosynthesis